MAAFDRRWHEVAIRFKFGLGRLRWRLGQVDSGPEEVALPDGQHVVLPKAFWLMTADELAGLGILPGLGEQPVSVRVLAVRRRRWH